MSHTERQVVIKLLYDRGFFESALLLEDEEDCSKMIGPFSQFILNKIKNEIKANFELLSFAMNFGVGFEQWEELSDEVRELCKEISVQEPFVEELRKAV